MTIATASSIAMIFFICSPPRKRKKLKYAQQSIL